MVGSTAVKASDLESGNLKFDSQWTHFELYASFFRFFPREVNICIMYMYMNVCSIFIQNTHNCYKYVDQQ